MKTIDAMNFVGSKLKTAFEELSESNRLKVEIPESIEEYRLTHPNGAALVVYRGSDYEDAGVSGFTVQKRNMEIGVILVVRRKSERMNPEEYVDFVLDKLSGAETGAKFNSKKVHAVQDEWIKEENGIWFYGVTFAFPNDFVESAINNG